MSIYPETLDIKPLNLSSKYKDFQQIVDEYNQSTFPNLFSIF